MEKAAVGLQDSQHRGDDAHCSTVILSERVDPDLSAVDAFKAPTQETSFLPIDLELLGGLNLHESRHGPHGRAAGWRIGADWLVRTAQPCLLHVVPLFSR